MNRQQLFDNFFQAVNGKGRALSSCGKGCVYFPPNDDPRTVHPGCAIGCQPGFRERFGGFDFDTSNNSIRGVIKAYPDVATFFQVEDDADACFLMRLQDLHDDAEHWSDPDGCGLYLNEDEVRNFCRNENLTSPV